MCIHNGSVHMCMDCFLHTDYDDDLLYEQSIPPPDYLSCTFNKLTIVNPTSVSKPLITTHGFGTVRCTKSIPKDNPNIVIVSFYAKISVYSPNVKKDYILNSFSAICSVVLSPYIEYLNSTVILPDEFCYNMMHITSTLFPNTAFVYNKYDAYHGIYYEKKIYWC